jgi:hypothetical protein
MRQPIRIIVGLVVWTALIAGPWLALRQAGLATQAEQTLSQLWHFGAGRCRTMPVEFAEPTLLAVNDPVLVVDHGTLRQVGEVRTLYVDKQVTPDRIGWVNSAEVFLYPTAPPNSSDTRITYRTTPQTLAWVAERLLTPARVEQMRRELEQALDEHRDEIAAVIVPTLERKVGEIVRVIEAELPPVIERHRAEIDALSIKYNRTVVQDRLVPLVKDQIFPLVRERAEPEVRAVGHELWQRVSLWRFGWRVLYDAAPLPDRKLTEREWQRFIDEEAQPILTRHTPEFLRVINEVLRDVSRNPEVQQAMRQSLDTLAADPELRQLVQAIFRETVTDNPRVKAEVQRQYHDPQLRDAVNRIADRLEPTVRNWGDMIFGTPHGGITPEFAQILRLQILGKDRRFLLLENGPEDSIPTEALPPVVRVLTPSGDAK